MGKIFAFALFALLASCASGARQPSTSQADELMVPGSANLPVDARKVVERLAGCSHFAGEFNGDGSERDKEVAAATARLRCETIEQDASAIRTRYSGNRAVLEALVAASQF
jgi:hypothetical protein